MVNYPSPKMVAYPLKGKTAALAAPVSKQIFIYNVRAANNSGGAANVGLLRQLVSPQVQLLKLVTGVYTDITAAVLAGTATAVFTGTANDGFAIQSQVAPGLFGFTISTAQAGGVFAYQYWNGASWATLTTVENPTDYSATGDTYVVFRAPYDWVVGGTSVPNPLSYSMRVVSTTGPAGAVSITNFWVGEMLELYSGVANNAMVQLSFPESKPFVCESGQGLFPYFSAANAANQFGAFYVAK